MAAFGIGAALPLLAMGLLSREAMMRWRGKLLEAGSGGKTTLGVVLVIIGLMILTGADKALEARLVELSPDWLTQLTTRY
jgi:sulfite exporter TauE/SafE